MLMSLGVLSLPQKLRKEDSQLSTWLCALSCGPAMAENDVMPYPG